MEKKTGSALAHPNIALAKYWGKRDHQFNIPAVDSISVTLNDLWTKTHIETDASLKRDRLLFEGDLREDEKVDSFLERVRNQLGVSSFFRVETESNFAPRIGLASSASGFAALTMAIADAFELDWSKRKLSVLARQGSGSAARSMFGGFVQLHSAQASEDSYAEQIAGPDHWELFCVSVIIDAEPKLVGSREGMNRTEATSPYYDYWLSLANKTASDIREGIRNARFERVAEAVERNTCAMHGAAMAAYPPVVYWSRQTERFFSIARRLRDEGIPAVATADAGPNVHLFTNKPFRDNLLSAVKKIGTFERIITSSLGPGAYVASE